MHNTTDHQAREEPAIRALLERWAEATRNATDDLVLQGHADDALIFDVLPPLKYDSAAEYRKSWSEWQPTFEIPSLFELEDLRVVAGDDVAFAHAIIRCGGKTPKGKVEDRVRATFCFRKQAGSWRIVHQHISMPVRPGGAA